MILPKEYSIQCFLSANDIPALQWNLIVEKASIFLSLNYLLAIERSWQQSHRFIYVIVFKKGLPVAILYFQAIDLSSIKIGSVIQAEPYGKFLKLVSDKITHALIHNSKENHKWILVNGNMSVSGMYGISILQEEVTEIAKFYTSILQLASQQLPGHVSVVIVKDFPACTLL